ncbi:MOSC domain-containing protein [Streptomyces aurantiacus]|uniref:MOSC domain-containing protein n=1 Tax=Streptomyces aurantiacus JA 4570 TaxID=1286094 RepID=S3ZLN9_9ACTN|nr:MOSC domain-containing protein [Streptomyces aurantiacus]EPH44446.1 hypothetical protein STRAU_2506 [Streptomyces aurantiacus JA 4570]
MSPFVNPRASGAASDATDVLWSGVLLEVFAAETAGVEMHALAEAELLAGVGIHGDRYATGRGHYAHLPHADRQLTLIAQEVLDAVEAETGIRLSGQESRRNMVTRGVPLNDLVGTYFAIGDAVVFGGRLNVPCAYLERLIDKPVFTPLVGRSGLNCQIVRGARVRPGQVIRPLPDWPGDSSSPNGPGDPS